MKEKCVINYKDFKDPICCILHLHELDPELLAIGTEEKTIRIYNFIENKCYHTIKAHEDYVSALIFFRLEDSFLLISGGASKDPTVKSWKLLI